MAATLHLSKHHGLGNDFLVALASRQGPGVALPRAADAIRWCDRHRGVGADGLIVASPAPPGSGADLVMELFNADGSVAEISGNGIRCLCQAELNRRGDDSGSVMIDTLGGRRRLDAWATDDADTLMVRVDMGPVTLGGPVDSPLVPAAAEHHGSASVGNPHLVFDLGAPDRVEKIDLAQLGSALEAATAGGVNVHVASATGPSTIVARHWERGAGLTEACGTGATVTAALMARWGLTGNRAEVAMPGGSVTVDLGGDPSSSAVLEGPSVRIAEIEVRAPRAGIAQDAGDGNARG